MTLLQPAGILGFLLISSMFCNAAFEAGTNNLVNTSLEQFSPITIDNQTTRTRFIISDYFSPNDPNRRWIPKISYDPRTERRLENHESFEQCLEFWRALIGGEGRPTDLDEDGIHTSSYGFRLDVTVRSPFPGRNDEIEALDVVSQNLNHFLDRDRDPDWGYRPLNIRILSSFRLLGRMLIWYEPDWQPEALRGPSINQTMTTTKPTNNPVQVAKSRRKRGSNPGSLPVSLGTPNSLNAASMSTSLLNTKLLNATSLNTTSLQFSPITVLDHKTGTRLVMTDKLDLNNPNWLPTVSVSAYPKPGVANKEKFVDCLRQWRNRISFEGPPEELDEEPSSIESYGYMLEITPIAPYPSFLDESAALWQVIEHLGDFLETEHPLPGPYRWYRPIQVDITHINDPYQLLAVMQIEFDPRWEPQFLELLSANRSRITADHTGADLARSRRRGRGDMF